MSVQEIFLNVVMTSTMLNNMNNLCNVDVSDVPFTALKLFILDTSQY